MRDRVKNLTGQTITTVKGRKHVLSKLVGYGGQGLVYEDSTGKLMVKLYYPSEVAVTDKILLERLRFISRAKMLPNFVGIDDVIEVPYIGYVMKKVSGYQPLTSYLIPDRQLSFSEWYNRDSGLRGRLFIGFVIAKAFHDLERKNLSYCDISGSNILVKVENKVSVKIIDVDNIYVAGRGSSSVVGTPRYIAPEVINQQMNPDIISDNYSLAVILFELLRVGHPYIGDDILDGSTEDEDRALNGQGEYVTPENSTSMLPANVVLTAKLDQLFRKCFVDGKTNRMARPSARDFEIALLEASNKVTECPKCGAWHYPIDGTCPWCDATSHPVARLEFFEALVMGDDPRTAVPMGGASVHHTNSYILARPKHLIKYFYVHGYDAGSSDDYSKNYMSVCAKGGRYYAYNEYSREGIYVMKEHASKYAPLVREKPIMLEDGDRIYFDVRDDDVVSVGGKTYRLYRYAIYDERIR